MKPLKLITYFCSIDELSSVARMPVMRVMPRMSEQHFLSEND
jgi:hypothetical protein